MNNPNLETAIWCDILANLPSPLREDVDDEILGLMDDHSPRAAEMIHAAVVRVLVGQAMGRLEIDAPDHRPYSAKY